MVSFSRVTFSKKLHMLDRGLLEDGACVGSLRGEVDTIFIEVSGVSSIT